MSRAALLLGSNLGDRELLLRGACSLISSDIGAILRASRLYESAPWGVFEGGAAEGGAPVPPFLNQALVVDTPLAPEALLDAAQAIEARLGRTEKGPKGGLYRSRPIDIDILLYDTLILRSERLTIPHPRLHERRFALEPLSEIAPQALHPVTKTTIRELFQSYLFG